MADAQLTVLTGFIAGRRMTLPPRVIVAGRNDEAGSQVRSPCRTSTSLDAMPVYAR